MWVCWVRPREWWGRRGRDQVETDQGDSWEEDYIAEQAWILRTLWGHAMLVSAESLTTRVR